MCYFPLKNPRVTIAHVLYLCALIAQAKPGNVVAKTLVKYMITRFFSTPEDAAAEAKDDIGATTAAAPTATTAAAGAGNVGAA